MISEAVNSAEPKKDFFFFGRRDIISLLSKRLDAHVGGYRQNIAILGPLYIGKTFLITHFLKLFYPKDLVPIYVNVSDVSLQGFVNRFFESINSACQLSSIDLSKMPRTCKYINLVQESLNKRQYKEVFNKVFDIAQILGRESKKKAIIVIDEFDKLEDFKIRGIFELLGKKVMIQKDVMYFLLSSSVEHSKNILNRDLSLLFGKFEILALEYFDFLEAKLFLKEKFSGLNISEDVLDFFISFTLAHPFYLDIISDHILRNSQINKTLDVEKFFCVLEDVFVDEKGYLSQVFRRKCEHLAAKYGHETMDVLWSVSNGCFKKVEISQNVKVSAAVLSSMLGSLVKEEILDFDGAVHRIKDSMFCFWVRNVYADCLNGLEHNSEIFRQKLRKYFGEYVHYRNDTFSLVGDLLKCFDDNRVNVGEKNVILPKFDRVEIFYKELSSLKSFVCYGKTKWFIGVNTGNLNEMDVLRFIEGAKKEKDVKRMVIISFDQIDHNVSLLAKDKKVLFIDLMTMNKILSMYDMPLTLGLQDSHANYENKIETLSKRYEK